MRHDRQKKQSGGAKTSILLLVILLILIGLPVLYLSVGFSYAEPETQAARAPMPSSERYAFHAGTRTVEIAVDASDIGWLLRSEEGLSDALDEVAAQLAPYHLELARYGVAFSDGVAKLGVQLRWHNVLPIPLEARFAVDSSGTQINANLQDVYLGRLIRLSADTLPLPKEARAFSLDLTDIHSRFRQLENARIEGERLVLTCGVGREIVAEALANFESVDHCADFLGDFEAIAVSRALLDSAHADYAPFDALLKTCEQDPGYFVEFKRSELAVAEDFKARLYLTNAESAMLARFLPELTLESVETLSAQYDAQCNARIAELTTVVTNLQALNEARQIASDGKNLITLSPNRELLTPERLSGGAALFDWLDPASVRFAYGTRCSEYMTFRLDAISKMPKEDKNAFSGMNGNAKYAPVLLLRTVTGKPVAAFDPTGAGLMLLPLDEETFVSALESERIPVVDLDAEMLM